MIYKLYIPKQFTDKNFDNDDTLVQTNFDHIRSELKRLTNGWTEYDGQGFWVNDKGKEFSEPVKVFEIVSIFDLDKIGLQETLKYLKSCLNQESIFYTRNGEGFYV